MSYKEIIDNVSNIEDLDNTTILKVLEKFSKTIKDFAIEQSGLNNLVNVEFIPSDNNTTYTGDSVDYLGTLKLTLSDNIIVNKPCNIKFNIKGSNTIVVDVDEFNNSLELHLDNSVVTTLAFAESERQKSKNLFKSNFWNKSSNVFEENGITFTYNPDDYSITINGTATAKALCYLNPDALSNIRIGTYAFSGFSKKTDYNVYIQAFNEAEGNYPALLYSSDNGFKTKTFNILPNFTDLYISVDAGIVVDNLVLKFQAEEGSVATNYQPYNGAIVHEKEIADVEHIETIYDESNTNKNIINGVAYTNGIPTNTELNINLSSYKYAKIYTTGFGILFLTIGKTSGFNVVGGDSYNIVDTTVYDDRIRVKYNNTAHTFIYQAWENKTSLNLNEIKRIEGVY